MVKGIEQRHTREVVSHHRYDREGQVNHQQTAAEGFHTGQSLIGPLRGLGGKQPHPANAQKRKHRNEHTDNPDATDPLQNRAPDQQIPIHIVEPAEHGGPRGCDTRCTFEESISGGNSKVTEVERQG